MFPFSTFQGFNVSCKENLQEMIDFKDILSVFRLFFYLADVCCASVICNMICSCNILHILFLLGTYRNLSVPSEWYIWFQPAYWVGFKSFRTSYAFYRLQDRSSFPLTARDFVQTNQQIVSWSRRNFSVPIHWTAGRLFGCYSLPFCNHAVWYLE